MGIFNYLYFYRMQPETLIEKAFVFKDAPLQGCIGIIPISTDFIYGLSIRPPEKNVPARRRYFVLYQLPGPYLHKLLPAILLWS